MHEIDERLIEIYKNESKSAIDSIVTKDILEFWKIVLKAYKAEKTIYACGNGGNVASVSNLVLDLNMHPFVSEDKSARKGSRNNFHAVSLCDSPAAITGMVNDIGFDGIFAEQLKYQANIGDVLFAMSGSGNSGNIKNVLKEAISQGMTTVLITRGNETQCEEYANLTIRVTGTSIFPGNTGGNNNNFHYEDCISKVTHIVVGLLKKHVQNISYEN
jgi:D-sedoheptulose 7-phosphate isomerase